MQGRGRSPSVPLIWDRAHVFLPLEPLLLAVPRQAVQEKHRLWARHCSVSPENPLLAGPPALLLASPPRCPRAAVETLWELPTPHPHLVTCQERNDLLPGHDQTHGLGAA